MADNHPVRLFTRAPAAPPAQPLFAAWLVRQFARDEPTAGLTFQRLEEVCSRAGSLLCGAVYARPGDFADRAQPAPEHAQDAAAVARRTADGFRAALADRQHAVIVWPWDHIATRVAWVGTRRGATDEESLGGHMEAIAIAYERRYRAQLLHVLELWDDVAATTGRLEAVGGGGLEAMGLRMWEAFRATQGSPAGS